MSIEEITKGNKLLAEFMGFTVKESHPIRKVWKTFIEIYPLASANDKTAQLLVDGVWKDSTVLEFHKSYDWLIPVCGKISRICEEPEELDELRMALLCADIDTAWKECVNWITNYNKLNETDKV